MRPQCQSCLHAPLLTNLPPSPIYSDQNPLTLTRFILSRQRSHPEATGDLTLVLNSIATATKSISSAVRRAGLSGLLGLQGSSNVSGDDQKKLDVISNHIFINLLSSTGVVASIVSEEDEEMIICPEIDGAIQKYVVVMDPLDGSSNIDCNGTIGSIFGIFRRENTSHKVTNADALLPGTSLVCAGYVAFGSSTQLVIAFKEDVREQAGVNCFTLDPTIGEFVLSQSNLKFSSTPQRIYSANEGSLNSFPAFVKSFIAGCKDGEKPYSLRYVGSMIADVHRTILYGGCFIYPSTLNSPQGKLRLLYEGAPMAFITEAAGGRACTGGPSSSDPLSFERVLDVKPTKLHQRCSLLLGSKRDIDLLEDLWRKENAKN